jgi:hypothetical protein
VALVLARTRRARLGAKGILDVAKIRALASH